MKNTLLLSLLFCACTQGPPDRSPDDRTPLTASCDNTDPTRCLLPWPSSRFTVADESTETGIRLAMDPSGLPVADRVDYLNQADGFSRVTGVAASFIGPIDLDGLSWDPADSLTPDAPLQVIEADPNRATYGHRIPFRVDPLDGSDSEEEKHLIIGRPAVPLAANTDHVFIITDAIGNDAETPREVQVSLGLVRPRNSDERELAAWHAPTRDTLETAAVDFDSVRRLSVFTTRSQADTTRRIHSMMDTLGDSLGDLAVDLDSATTTGSEHIAVILRGRLTGAPSFLTDEGYLLLDDNGLPTVTGTTSIEFRLSVPAGTDDFRFVLYGHGTGGNVTDDSFDRELGEYGIGKLNLRYDGWTDDDFVQTLLGFSTFLDGSERSTAGLMEALAGGTTLLSAMDGVLGDLIAEQADGRRPITNDVAWVGGSMGGTMGAVIVSADPRLQTAVLNVPGAGWTHMIPDSLLYNSGMESIMETTYGDRISIHLGMVMAQTSWDDVDGSVWAEEALERGGTFLMQESMDDPVLPNIGTELLANALNAVHLQPALSPIHGLKTDVGPTYEGTTLTQFRVPPGSPYDIHGFAARETPAGAAALGQILVYLDSAWNEDKPIMAFPSGCSVTPTGDCDFSEMWTED